jgi:hypothetical protein
MFVIPAQAGIQTLYPLMISHRAATWIPDIRRRQIPE